MHLRECTSPAIPASPPEAAHTIHGGTSSRRAPVSHGIQAETARPRFELLLVWPTTSTQLYPWAAWPLHLRLQSVRSSAARVAVSTIRGCELPVAIRFHSCSTG